jgi:hypothetical protein
MAILLHPDKLRRMKCLPILFLVLSSSCWGQSLGDVARQSREKAGPHARKTITNDDLADSQASSATVNPEGEVAAARKILKDKCGNPQMDKERTLSESEMQIVAEAVRTLRERLKLSEQKLKEYGQKVGEFAEEQKTGPSEFTREHPGTDGDSLHTKPVSGNSKTHFEELIRDAKTEGKLHEDLMNELGLAAKQCSSAF